MKRADVREGADYYHDSSQGWQGRGTGDRVRVISTQALVPVRAYGYRAHRDVEPMQVTGHDGTVYTADVRKAGPGDKLDSVLVISLTVDGERALDYNSAQQPTPRPPFMVRTAELRGDWAELHEAALERNKLARERDEKRRAEASRREAYGHRLVARAHAIGVELSKARAHELMLGNITLTLDELDELILRAEGVDL